MEETIIMGTRADFKRWAFVTKGPGSAKKFRRKLCNHPESLKVTGFYFCCGDVISFLDQSEKFLCETLKIRTI